MQRADEPIQKGGAFLPMKDSLAIAGKSFNILPPGRSGKDFSQKWPSL
jgi:hypothetical protein